MLNYFQGIIGPSQEFCSGECQVLLNAIHYHRDIAINCPCQLHPKLKFQLDGEMELHQEFSKHWSLHHPQKKCFFYHKVSEIAAILMCQCLHIKQNILCQIKAVSIIDKIIDILWITKKVWVWLCKVWKKFLECPCTFVQHLLSRLHSWWTKCLSQLISDIGLQGKHVKFYC